MTLRNPAKVKRLINNLIRNPQKINVSIKFTKRQTFFREITAFTASVTHTQTHQFVQITFRGSSTEEAGPAVYNRQHTRHCKIFLALSHWLFAGDVARAPNLSVRLQSCWLLGNHQSSRKTCQQCKQTEATDSYFEVCSWPWQLFELEKAESHLLVTNNRFEVNNRLKYSRV